VTKYYCSSSLEIVPSFHTVLFNSLFFVTPGLVGVVVEFFARLSM